jgi:hypothetical protein
VIKRVLVIGNSLTKHPPLAGSDWDHDWGMAATRMENDFAHLLHQMICRYQPSPKSELIVHRLYDPDLLVPAAVKSVTENCADLIVVELGDNLQPEKIDPAKVPAAYENLLKTLKDKNPDAMILATSTWGANETINRIMEKACKNQATIFVNISDLIGNPKNSAASEGRFKHPGVAWHPGDRGMKEIATRLWNTIRHEMIKKEFHLKQCTTTPVK